MFFMVGTHLRGIRSEDRPTHYPLLDARYFIKLTPPASVTLPRLFRRIPMKFFAALKSAEFATKLFAAAGFDFNVAQASADENALKAFIDSKAVSADATQLATLNAALESANSENAAHLAKIEELNAAITTHVPLLAQNSRISSSLAACGVKIDLAALGAAKTNEESEALFRSALDSRISTKARELVASTGGPLLDETPAPDATKPASKSPVLVGLAATQALFEARLNDRRN
jgi:hypothetical protein